MGQPIEGSNPSLSAFASLKLGYGEMQSAKKSESGIRLAEVPQGRKWDSLGYAKAYETKSAFSVNLSDNSSYYNWSMFYVYILLCSDNKTYIGCTDNLKDRLKRHHDGHVPATKNRLPITLLTYFAFKDKYTGYSFEKYLKSGSGRAFLKRHVFEQ